MNRRNFIKNSILGLCGLFFVAKSAEASIFKPSQKKMSKYLEQHSLVVYKDGKTMLYDERGVKPLMLHLENSSFEGAYVADKRVGKASALLLAYGKVKEVYTPVISKPAIEVFNQNNIKYFAVKIVDNIQNQNLDDICPMEKKVQDINSPQEAYELFKSM